MQVYIRINTVVKVSAGKDVRSCAKRALVSVLANGGEGVRDDSDKQIDEPEVEYNNAHNEKEARDKEFSIHHVVHQR